MPIQDKKLAIAALCRRCVLHQFKDATFRIGQNHKKSKNIPVPE